VENDGKYWVNAKVCVRFVNKSQAVVIVKNLLINDVFAMVFNNHFTTFNQFMDTTFEKIAWFCVKEHYFTSSIYMNRARIFCTDLIL